MTSKVMPSIIQIEKENLKHLVSQVKETLATDIKMPTITPKYKKPACPVGRFGIVDMWNCQRNVRTAVSMRRH